jgi:hypothetical protein
MGVLEQVDGFHFGIFRSGAFATRDTQLLEGFGRYSGYVAAYPAGLALAAVHEVVKLEWLASGEYVVVGVRLRDHMVVKQHVTVAHGESRRKALVLSAPDDEDTFIEGDMIEVTSSRVAAVRQQLHTEEES